MLTLPNFNIVRNFKRRPPESHWGWGEVEIITGGKRSIRNRAGGEGEKFFLTKQSGR